MTLEVSVPCKQELCCSCNSSEAGTAPAKDALKLGSSLTEEALVDVLKVCLTEVHKWQQGGQT